MAEVGNLTAKLTLDTVSFSDSISKVEQLASGLAGGIGKAFGGIATAVGAAVAASSAAVYKLADMSVKSYANYEQLIGGVETMFKGSAGIIEDYAQQAYKTAGISANEYMQQVTSFSAALISSLDGDTTAAAQTADMAIKDMADNANKMGTSIEAIQNAYQGFAKQNYTMLDNLKLGYGGTEKEMKRLLKDAQELTGIKYDINNLDDVYNAIHAIQEQMGITGTTALEAGTTISGSWNMVKAAFQDTLTSIAGGGKGLQEAIQALVESTKTWLGNLLPVIKEALYGIGDLIQGIVPIISAELPQLLEYIIPHIVDAVMSITNALIEALPQAISTLMTAVSDLLPLFVSTFMSLLDSLLTNILPQLFDLAMELVLQLGNGITENLSQIGGSLLALVEYIITTILEHLPKLLQIGISIITMLAQGIADNIDRIIQSAIEVLDYIIRTLLDNLPELVEVGLKLLLAIAEGIVLNMHRLLDTVMDLIPTIVNAIIQNLPVFLEIGMKIIITIAEGILLAVPMLLVSFLRAIGVLEKSAQESQTNLVSGISNTSKQIDTQMSELSSKYNSSTQQVSNDAKQLLEASDKSSQELDRAANDIIATGMAAKHTMNDVTSGIIVSANIAKSGVADAFREMADAVGSAANQIAAYCASINSSFGSISGPSVSMGGISGHRASGGPVSAGQVYMTGEQGRELFMAPSDGYIYNHEDTEDMLRGSGGTSIIIQGDVYDDPRSMRDKLREAVLDIMEEQFA